jgi:putative phosphoesterase
MKIGLISDTHGYMDERIFHHLQECDEVWHAGDIGSEQVIDELEAFCSTSKRTKTLRLVYGNIDDHKIRMRAPLFNRFVCELTEIVITHIGGKPGNFSRGLFEEIKENGAPKLLVCGHSHILAVKMDQYHKMLWMNPGACGNKGFHNIRTMLRFEINGDKIENLEAIELGKR